MSLRPAERLRRVAAAVRAARDRVRGWGGRAGEALARPGRRARDAWAGWRAAHPAVVDGVATGVHALAIAGIAFVAFLYGRHVLRVYGEATVDDAGITYSYAENLARGEGLRMTPHEAPTEGYSNPLQVFLLVPFALVTDDLDPASKAINIGLAAAALGLLCAFVYAQLRSVARVFALVPLGLATYWCGFNYWIAAGLEGGLLASLQILSLLALYYAPRRKGADIALGVFAGLLAWTRPEGIVYGAIAVLARFFGESRERRFLAAGIFAGFVGALCGMRWVCFHDVVPNTYWAKVPGRDFWWSIDAEQSPGRRYVTGFLRERGWYFAIPVWAAAPAWGPGQAVTLAAAGQFLFALAFPVYVGGDWMAEWRFMQPMMGPLVVLSALGTVGLLAGERRLLPHLARAVSVAGVFGLCLVTLLVPPTWKERRKQIAQYRDIDLRTVEARVDGYRRLVRALHLRRPPLVAEVDIGGLSYRSGLEVLDVAGLADRALALARARQPAIAPDYVFGERLPEVIHLHASWLGATPMHRLSAFRSLYRELSGACLEKIGMGALTAVRADLLDPPAAPALRIDAALPGVKLTGVSAVPVAGARVLVLHGRQAGGRDPAPAWWRTTDGRRYPAPWHGGLGVAMAVPQGAVLVAATTVPAATPLPLTLEGTRVRLDAWPDGAADDGSVAALSRIPLLRAAGVPLPRCDPGRLLDPRATAVSRARGAGFVAFVCGGLPEAVAERWQEGAMDAAEAAGDPDDRYEAAAATLPLGLPQWLSTRILLEETRPAHTPFDEVLDAWAREDFKAAVEEPARVATGLRLLLTARRWSTVVLQGLAWGADDPAVRGPVCTAARRLGLRADALAPGLDCSAVPDAPPVRVVRQSFEDPDADDLTFAGRMRTMRPTPMRRIQSDQHEVYGGHGRLLINTYDEELRDRALGAVVWGPLPWPGRRFGALVGGGKRSDETHVVVEGWKDGAWVTLARMTNGHEEESLIAQIADLGPVPLPWVRARVVDASTGGWGHIIADGLTFVDVDTAR